MFEDKNVSAKSIEIDITYLESTIFILFELAFQLKPNRRKNMEDYDFNPNRSAEIAVGAFIALLAIGVVKVIVQSLLD